jgi:uncharacterized protein DUF5801
MPLDVNNVFLTVDEDQVTPNNDGDEVASFTPTYNASLAAAVAAISTAPPTAVFGTTQIAGQDNFFTIGANTNDLKFVQNLGGTAFPTAGPGVNSGLTTAGGTGIYLFQSATTDNVIYGAIGDNPANPAAFIIVLDEQLTGPDVTNAKLWILQYAAIKHDDQNVVEGDIVDLLNKVFVASSGTVEAVFSNFSDVPAGSPIFAMIADDTNANPIDYLVTAYQDGAKGTGIQLNVSNQGSFPGSLASGSQNISYGTALRFDLVTNGVNNYTQSEGQSDTAIAFDTHQNVTEAGFAIVQNQGNRPTDLKIELWNSLSDTADGHNFFTSVLNEASVAIDKILVGTINPNTGVITPLYDSSNPADASHFVVSGNAITVLDLGLNYVVNIFQDSGFDRFTALNVTTTVNNKGQTVPDTNAFVDIGRLTFTTTSPTADVDEVGSKIQIDDSGPTIAIQGTVAALDVDDSGLAGGTNVGVGLTDTVDVSTNFTSTTGADGAGAVGYTMKVVNGTDSGLDDVATGDSILLRLNGSGVVEGYLSAHTTDVAFTVSVNSSGVVTLTHMRAIKHSPGGVDETASAIAADAIKVTGTITDTEGVPTGDTASADLPIGDKLNFHDDEPTIQAQNATINTLNVDDDTLGAPGSDTIDASGLFTKVYGADGPDAVAPVAYALSTTDGPSGVFDVATGLEVQLKTTAGVVHGYVTIAAVDVDVFTVGVSASGVVTLTQQRAIQHTDVPPASDNSQDPTNLVGTNLIKLTATITDKDGDTAPAVSDLTGALQFNDGQPSISAGSVTPASLSTDDDALGAGGAATASVAASFTKNFGPDGAAASNDTTYAMTTSGGPSGVFDVSSGLEVQLKLDTGVVHGYVTIAAVDVDVFTVSVDANGLTTLTQLRAIKHTDVPPATDNSADPTGLSGSNKIGVAATVTDRDGDTKSATLDLTPAIQFTDGQPSITAPFDADPVAPGIQTPEQLGNAVGQTASGAFGYNIGPDDHLAAFYAAGGSDFVDVDANLANVQISLTGTVDNAQNPGITNAVVTRTAETATSASFDFSFHYDKDPITAGVQDATAGGTLVFDKANDTYTFTLNDVIDGFSFDVLHTNELLQKVPTGNTGHPEIVVTELDVDSPGAPADGFYVQFTANSNPQANAFGFNGTGDGAPVAGDTTFNNGQFVTSNFEDWVSATQSTNGVAGDTIQKGELLTLRFFKENILSDAADNDPGTPGVQTIEKVDPTTTAAGVAIKFDGIGNSEDLVVILDLKDTNGNETTRSINVQNADLIKGAVPSPYNTEFSLDNNDALLVIESNDYNAAGETYQIQGIQIMQSANGLTGQAINLNGAVGTGGGSNATGGLTAWDPLDNDVLKIVDIGFIQNTSGTLNADLDFSFTIVDGDNDVTALQHILVNVSNDWIV